MVDFWDEQVARLEITDEFIGLSKAQTRIDRTVNYLHRKGLIGSKCLEVREIRFHKDDAVIAMRTPEFEKMNYIAEPQ